MPTITITTTTTVEKTKFEMREDLIEQIVATGPEHFDMAGWFMVGGEDGTYYELEEVKEVRIKSCGTTACLGGHAASLLVHGYKMDPSTDEVADLIGSTGRLAEFFGFESAAFSSESVDWPAVMQAGYHAQLAINPDDEHAAQWRGALTYLVSLSDVYDD